MERAPLLNTAGCGSSNDPAVTVCFTPSLLNQLTMVPTLTSRSSNVKSSILEEMIAGPGAPAAGVGDGGTGVDVTGRDVAVGTGLEVACSAVAAGSAIAVGCAVTVPVLIGRGVEVGAGVAEELGLGGMEIAVAGTGAGATVACSGGVKGTVPGPELEHATPMSVNMATAAAKACLVRRGIKISVTGRNLLDGTQHSPIRLSGQSIPGSGHTSSRKAGFRPDITAKALNLIRSDHAFRIFHLGADIGRSKNRDGIYRRARGVIESQRVYGYQEFPPVSNITDVCQLLEVRIVQNPEAHCRYAHLMNGV